MPIDVVKVRMQYSGAGGVKVRSTFDLDKLDKLDLFILGHFVWFPHPNRKKKKKMRQPTRRMICPFCMLAGC